MIEIVLIVTAILSIRLKFESMLAVLFFSGFCLMFNISEIHIENNYNYYLFACLIDLFIIEFISLISKPTKTMVSIHTICRWFVYANLSGFIIYYLELPYIIYTVFCGSLYVAALLSAFFQGGSNGIHRDSDIHSGFYTYHHAGQIALQQNKKATGT